MPDEIADQLKARAQRNHRSVQGEIMAILEDAIGGGPGLREQQRAFLREDHQPISPARKLTIREIAQWAKLSGLKTAPDSVQMIREDRDR
ncbi:MAG TPA: Arc family DNA-binding protein [Rhizomicrobium sp.]|nr:Arc family DNA-binding protein [Rhizomicrobium sp.]